MLPYYPQPVVHVGPFQIHAFGVLAAVAVVVGGRAILVRAHRQGIPVEQMFRFCFWVYICAMAGAFLSKAVLDDFPGLLVDPSRIFKANLGVRSVGGISSGFLAGLVWCRVHRLSALETLRRLDIIAYALPIGWLIGRLGCTLAHDHRGLASTSWVAVAFPEGPRYDLGLIEFLFLIGMVTAFWWLDRRPRPVGFYLGLYGVVYGGFRIWLDTLHVQPGRFYGGALGVSVGLIGWAVMLVLQRQQPAEAAASLP
ncbi:MAG TPA: prolipoprotein diacylglyceryl transferase family protein [Bryobacteraceae bacterium]|jgi:phosphatidylglycerol:prolipoprotein diacylglycerol transferase|nr:prolipoprotein diacylglyceryl transferase family protein [Bryobacteraceae bacterium]